MDAYREDSPGALEMPGGRGRLQTSSGGAEAGGRDEAQDWVMAQGWG